MKKITFTLLVFIGFCLSVSAQNNAQELLKQSVIYYFNKSGQIVDVKDSADYIRFMSPPDSTDLNLFVVRDFYLNGKPKLIGKSLIPNYYLKRQGMFIEYFPNGRRRRIENYENNVQTGDVTSYYPNGKFYCTYNFDKDLKQNIMTTESDSAGTVLAENGNGTWIEYDDNFKFVKATGPILNGKKDGWWHGAPNDSLKYDCTYSKGISVSGTSYEKSGKEHHFTKDIVWPEYKGGMANFYSFIGHNVHYPKVAKENNIQGKVFVSFIVEKDGTLTRFNILQGIGAGCDEEVLRVMKLSPQWSPEYKYGIAVAELVNLPVSFTLQNDN